MSRVWPWSISLASRRACASSCLHCRLSCCLSCDPSRVAGWTKLRGKLLSEDDYWSICMNDIEIGGKPQHLCTDQPNGCCKLVVDTGTS